MIFIFLLILNLNLHINMSFETDKLKLINALCKDNVRVAETSDNDFEIIYLINDRVLKLRFGFEKPECPLKNWLTGESEYFYRAPNENYYEAHTLSYIIHDIKTTPLW